MSNLGHYRKTIAAVVGTVLTWAGATYIPTGHVTRLGWYALAVALATAAGVYSVTNSPPPIVEPPALVEPPVVDPTPSVVVKPAKKAAAPVEPAPVDAAVVPPAA